MRLYGTRIGCGQRGADAFADPGVADELKLTDDQKRVVAGAIEAARTPAYPPPQPPAAVGGGVFVVNGFSQPDPKARKAAYEKVEAALTPPQKEAWKRMTGDAVGFDPHAVAAARGGLSVAGFGAVAAPAVPAVPGVPVIPPAKNDD